MSKVILEQIMNAATQVMTRSLKEELMEIDFLGNKLWFASHEKQQQIVELVELDDVFPGNFGAGGN